MAAVYLLVLIGLTMLASAATTARRDSSGSTAAASAGSAFSQHELSEEDPPREPRHQESPAKKPRLKALLVHTAPTTDPAQPLAFHLCLVAANPTPHLVQLHAEPVSCARREDPVLRLHPGQAPPPHLA